MQILQLNCAGLLSSDPESLWTILRGEHIICFEETWLASEASAPLLHGYTVYNFPRVRYSDLNTHRGGTAIYLANHLAPHANSWKPTYHSKVGAQISWLHIGHHAGLEDDLYIALCYFPPRPSQRNDAEEWQLIWDELEFDVAEATGLGDVLVLGDFNAHTGASMGRHSEDASRPINASGRALLQLCSVTSLTIGNGTVVGDSSGAFTFWNSRELKSVTDYFLLSSRLHSTALRLEVQGPPPLASLDHCPMRLSLKNLLSSPLPSPSPHMQVPLLPPQPRFSITAEIREAFVSRIKETAQAALATITEAAAASTGPTETAAALESFCDFYSTTLTDIGATHVPTGKGGVQCPRAKLRARIRANPAMKDLITRRRRAHRHRQLELVRSLDKQIRNLSRALSKQMRSKIQEQLFQDWRKDHRSFWKTYNACGSTSTQHSAAAMHQYCQELLGSTASSTPLPDDLQLPPHLIGDGHELNVEFTPAEIVAGLRRLKGSKASAGIFNLDLFKPVADEIAPTIAALFNAVVRDKCMPRDMAIGVITMVLKPRAATTQLCDHRTITVCSLLDKLYSTCLTQRLSAWGETYCIRADSQTGFRPFHQTSDNVLVLRAATERARHDQQPLYVAFVDFKKAYDTVSRDKLWSKLQHRGVDGWMLEALQAQYANVPLSVKTPAGLTAPFTCTVGLKQGEPTSPDLFGLYVDDLPAYIQQLRSSATFPSLNGMTVPPLLHADDVALLSTSLEGLQAQLDKLQEYADIWDLQISLVKTNIMQLSGPGLGDNLATRPSLQLQGQPLPWVTSFVYLGVTFNENADMDISMFEQRLLKARRAQAVLLGRCAALGVTNPALQLSLWDTVVRSTMGYGVEIWGPGLFLKNDGLQGKDAGEVMHRRFLRRLLNVRASTNNLILYAECGRYPLRYFFWRMIYQFWRRVTALASQGDRELLTAAVKDNMALATTQLAAGMTTPDCQLAWAGKIQQLFSSCAGIDFHLAQGPASYAYEPAFIETIGQQQHLELLRLASGTRDMFYKQHIRNWTQPQDISISSYDLPAYLQQLMPLRSRWDLSRFRTSSHYLRIEIERHIGRGRHCLPREQRTCRFCISGAVEDEHHMVFECANPCFVQLRQDYASVFESGPSTLFSFLAQPPRQVAGFISGCFQAGDFEAKYKSFHQSMRSTPS